MSQVLLLTRNFMRSLEIIHGRHQRSVIWNAMQTTLHWRHNDHGGVSNHQPDGCLTNRWFRRRSKKTSKLRVTDHCAGNSPGPVNSPHKGPVTRKIFPFDDVIMYLLAALVMMSWHGNVFHITDLWEVNLPLDSPFTKGQWCGCVLFC